MAYYVFVLDAAGGGEVIAAGDDREEAEAMARANGGQVVEASRVAPRHRVGWEKCPTCGRYTPPWLADKKG